jgi:hypothetical protein
MIEFYVDTIVNGVAHPTLQSTEPLNLDQVWVDRYPYTQSIDLFAYCNEFDYPITISTIDTLSTIDNNDPIRYYIIHIGFFDFTIDYIKLCNNRVLELVKSQQLRILFYYHEGDNPYRIKERLDALCREHSIDINSYVFVTGNTAARNIDNFIHFTDHELLFYLRNKNDKKILENHGSLMRTFSSLVRTHQWWRATALADLYSRFLLDNSYWSYNPNITVGNVIEDCPIEIDVLHLRTELERFISQGGHSADELTADQHNDHSITYMPHYTNAYCNIVFETLFDADGSAGAFLSEKTFKPIKHGQPFVIAGCVGSLQLLRDLGYRVFDGIIDNRYDTIENNTERWRVLSNTIEQIKYSDLERFRELCLSDVEHNQRLFLASKQARLNMLFQELEKK